MMAKAKVRTTKETERKNRKPKRKDRDYTVEIDKIADDGKVLMKIAKSKTVAKALPFGRFKVSDTTYVELCCNQDPRTAAVANKACRQLVRKFMKVDMAESAAILEEVAEIIAEEERD